MLLCVLLQVGVLALSMYNVTSNLMRLQAWYALFVYGLVPLGVIFFSFAAGCGIKGIFSLIMGEQQQKGAGHIGRHQHWQSVIRQCDGASCLVGLHLCMVTHASNGTQ